MNTKNDTVTVSQTTSAKDLLKQIRGGVLAAYQTRGKLR